jgi:hypothetical protein
MNTWRFRPSKPSAVFGALVGVGMLVIGLTSIKHGAFFVLWCVVVVGVIGFNLWAAFSPRGSVYEVRGDGDSPPGRFGMRSEREESRQS